VIRNSRDALLDAFDAPDGYTSTGRRNTTTTPTQALLLINGSWPLARARAFARRLEETAPPGEDERDRACVLNAYRLALGREPEPDELERVMRFLAEQEGRTHSKADLGKHEALVDFCHTMLNSNEFLYVD
jgi:hypothetical protein